jgi:hypothetical protein
VELDFDFPIKDEENFHEFLVKLAEPEFRQKMVRYY